jgi:hypothetical protein
MTTPILGIDLGGTKIEGAFIDPKNPERALSRLRLPTESEQGYDHILAQIVGVVEMLEKESGLSRPKKIGIGTPGTIEPSTGLLKNSNTLCLNKHPIKKDLERLLGVQVEVANDANCFALAETIFGAAKGRKNVVGIIIGTGVGGGIVIDGKVINGLHGIGGEWGHNPMNAETAPCYCGHKGCVENVFSGPALERFYLEHSGKAARLPEIVKRAADGDAIAGATLDRLVTKFGEAIAVIINILDPDAVVIGGGVGNIDLLYTPRARAEVLSHLFNHEVRTEFLKPTLGDSAGVFGAASLTL